MNDIILVANRNGNPIGGVKTNAASMRANAHSILRDRLVYGAHGTSHTGARDYYEILGYNREPDLDDYRAKFERDPMAGRIVEFPCEETWRDTPTIKDGKDKEAKDDTPFCNAWSEFAEARRVYHFCQRVDVLAGIGRFGLLHIGVAGSGELTSEVKRLRSLDDVIYLRPYAEESVEVYEWQTDPNNARFGLPHIYKFIVSNMAGATSATGFGVKQLLVHHSRCIHVAEGLLENEVYGRPRLQRVINLLDDILKVVGGSAEATWKLMRKGFVLNIAPEAHMNTDEEAALEEQFDEYDHGLRRYLQTRGMQVSDLGSEVVDPSGLFDVIVTLISVATGIPKRILLGSERGELASSQDAANWAGRIASRQLNFAEPVILRPLIDRLIRWGALPKPRAGRYTCVWDALFEQSGLEKATEAKTWAEAAEKAATATGGPVMTPKEYRGEFTPFAAELPPELTQAREDAKAAREKAALPVMPDEGEDVLDQVAKVVGNHGYNSAQGRALIVAAARIVSRQGL